MLPKSCFPNLTGQLPLESRPIIAPTFSPSGSCILFSSLPVICFSNRHWSILAQSQLQFLYGSFHPLRIGRDGLCWPSGIADAEPLGSGRNASETLWKQIFSEHFDGQTERKQLHICASLKTVLFFF